MIERRRVPLSEQIRRMVGKALKGKKLKKPAPQERIMIRTVKGAEKFLNTPLYKNISHEEKIRILTKLMNCNKGEVFDYFARQREHLVGLLRPR